MPETRVTTELADAVRTMTILELSDFIKDLQTHSSEEDPLEEEEAAAVLAALRGAHEAAERVIAAQDRNLHRLRANTRELRAAREIAAWSNRFALTRALGVQGQRFRRHP